MKFTVNGAEVTVENTSETYFITSLLDKEEYKTGFVAVAKNKEHIPKKDYQSTPINHGDEIEILSPIYGG